MDRLALIAFRDELIKIARVRALGALLGGGAKAVSKAHKLPSPLAVAQAGKVRMPKSLIDPASVVQRSKAAKGVLKQGPAARRTVGGAYVSPPSSGPRVIQRPYAEVRQVPSITGGRRGYAPTGEYPRVQRRLANVG